MTGASSGLGARFATVLAEAGAQVVACARRLERLEALARSQPGVVPVRCDVAEPDDRARLVRAAVGLTGAIDILVNNAGIASAGPSSRRPSTPSLRSCASMWSRSSHSHRLSRVICASGAPARVINISSMFGLVAATPVPDAPYVASKSALNGLTRELASQWASDGVRVNAIAPGWFSTEMNSELLEDERSLRWLQRQCPMGRPGLEHELDGILLFLASDASSYCTGQVIAIDGGWTVR